MKVVDHYKHLIRMIDALLYSLSTSEHGVLTGVLFVCGYLLFFWNKLIVLLAGGVGVVLFAVTAYVGYRLLERTEPKDDYE